MVTPRGEHYTFSRKDNPELSGSGELTAGGLEVAHSYVHKETLDMWRSKP